MKRTSIKTIPRLPEEPNKYSLHHKINYSKLPEYGFKHWGPDYILTKHMDNNIKLQIIILVPEKQYRLKVLNEDNNYYSPFYRKADRYNNRVYDKFIRDFNEFMDDLCEKQVLWRKNYKPIAQRIKQQVKNKYKKGFFKQKCYG